jgi:hypothetical protein
VENPVKEPREPRGELREGTLRKNLVIYLR